MKKYPKYKDSGVEWIGKIPDNWEVRRLKYITESIKEKSIDGSEELLSVSEHSGIIPRKEIREENETLTRSDSLEGYLRVRKGDLVNNIMLMWKRGLGVSRYNGIVSPAYSIFRFHYGSPRFYNYLLRTDLYISEFRKNSTGVIDSRLRLYDDEFGNISSHLPPLQEQQQIVIFLDQKTTIIDEQIHKKQRKIELLKEQRTSIINQAVTKGLNPNVKMKDSGVEWIGEIPEHWNKKKIKNICKIFGRIGYRGYTTDDIVNEGEGVITISPGNIKKDIFNLDTVTYLSFEKYYESPEIMIFPEDIILVKTGSTIGKTSIIPKETPLMTLNPQLIVLKEITINHKYFYYQTTCDFIKHSFEIEQTGGTTPTISQEKIYQFPVLESPLPEQQQIVEFLDKKTTEIDTTITLENKKIDLLKEYRQSLISEVVTGKIDVRKN